MTAEETAVTIDVPALATRLAETPTLALAQPVGQPFVARYGPIAGQRAIKAAWLPLIDDGGRWLGDLALRDGSINAVCERPISLTAYAHIAACMGCFSTIPELRPLAARGIITADATRAARELQRWLRGVTDQLEAAGLIHVR